jgi:hypothetical protein
MPDVFIDRNQAFGVKLTEGDVQRPLILSQGSQTIQSEVDAFPDADSGGTHEQQRIGWQVIDAAELLLEPLVLFWGERSGKILRQRGKVLGEDQPGLDGVAVVGKVPQ